MQADGKVTGSTFVPTLVAAANTSCSGYASGSVAKTAQGSLLSCQNDVWKAAINDMGMFGGGFTTGRYGCWMGNPLTGRTCSCPEGYVNRRVFERHDSYFDICFRI